MEALAPNAWHCTIGSFRTSEDDAIRATKVVEDFIRSRSREKLLLKGQLSPDNQHTWVLEPCTFRDFVKQVRILFVQSLYQITLANAVRFMESNPDNSEHVNMW